MKHLTTAHAIMSDYKLNYNLNYNLIEKFVSINGEGKHAGELAVFIRFPGCNLHCSYCDTQFANLPDAETESCSLQEILEFVRQSGAKRVTLTGGEPLLQPHLPALIQALTFAGYAVEIETNGSILIRDLLAQLEESGCRPSFTLDYKLPSSGMQSHMLTANYDDLRPDLDVVKFVTGTMQDLTCALEIIQNYDLTNRCQVYFSPVYGQIAPAVIVEFMKQHAELLHKAKMQLQLHKFIWNPEERGV